MERSKIQRKENSGHEQQNALGSSVSEQAAEQVSQAPIPNFTHNFGDISVFAPEHTVQRNATPDRGGDATDYNLSARIQAASGTGAPLEQNVQAQLETGIGADLSGVRVHDDSEADQLSRQLHANAFTTGDDIFFRQGLYNPNSGDGMRLLAHEATHTVQQANGAVDGVSWGGGVKVSEPNDRFEQAAEATAQNMTNSSRTSATPPSGSSSAGVVQREAVVEEEKDKPEQPILNEEKELQMQQDSSDALVVQREPAYTPAPPPADWHPPMSPNYVPPNQSVAPLQPTAAGAQPQGGQALPSQPGTPAPMSIADKIRAGDKHGALLELNGMEMGGLLVTLEQLRQAQLLGNLQAASSDDYAGTGVQRLRAAMEAVSLGRNNMDYPNWRYETVERQMREASLPDDQVALVRGYFPNRAQLLKRDLDASNLDKAYELLNGQSDTVMQELVAGLSKTQQASLIQHLDMAEGKYGVPRLWNVLKQFDLGAKTEMDGGSAMQRVLRDALDKLGVAVTTPEKKIASNPTLPLHLRLNANPGQEYEESNHRLLSLFTAEMRKRYPPTPIQVSEAEQKQKLYNMLIKLGSPVPCTPNDTVESLATAFQNAQVQAALHNAAEGNKQKYMGLDGYVGTAEQLDSYTMGQYLQATGTTTMGSAFAAYESLNHDAPIEERIVNMRKAAALGDNAQGIIGGLSKATPLDLSKGFAQDKTDVKIVHGTPGKL